MPQYRFYTDSTIQDNTINKIGRNIQSVDPISFHRPATNLFCLYSEVTQALGSDLTLDSGNMRTLWAGNMRTLWAVPWLEKHLN